MEAPAVAAVRRRRWEEQLPWLAAAVPAAMRNHDKGFLRGYGKGNHLLGVAVGVGKARLHLLLVELLLIVGMDGLLLELVGGVGLGEGGLVRHLPR